MKTALTLCVLALAVAAVAGYLPGPGWAVLWLITGAAIGLLSPLHGLTLLLALLPVASFAPVTGSIFVEEFDLLALGAMAMWLARTPRLYALQGPGRSWVWWWLASMSIAALHGMPAGGIEPDRALLATYHTGWNALRLAKPVVLAVLMNALLWNPEPDYEARLMRHFMWGNAAGLALVSVVCLWERAAFPGLTNFSADYRITGPFWEMHVGGAALDAYLALTLPAAMWWWWRARSLPALLAASLLFALGAVVVVSTFSRALQLGVALMLVVWALAWWRSRAISISAMSLFGALAMALFGAPALVAVFDHGGYRALAAVCVVAMMAVWLSRQPVPRAYPLSAWAGVIGEAGSGWVLSLMHAKAAYLTFAAALVLWLSAAALGATPALLWLLAIGQAGCALWVAHHWGGVEAAMATAVALSMLLSAAAVRALRGPAPAVSARGLMATAMALAVASLVAVLSHSAFMGERMSGSMQDAKGRVMHWAAGWAMWRGGDVMSQLFGAGLGRYPALAAAHLAQDGGLTHEFVRETGTSFLRLSRPSGERAVLDALRVSQSLPALPREAVVLSMAARTAGASVRLTVCYKHLLYAESCEEKRFRFNDTRGDFVVINAPMDLSNLKPGPWWAPRDAMVSLALQQGEVDIREVSMRDAAGREWLANTDFQRGPARWFFTSDHDHLPWHIKQMFLALLIETGVVGLVGFCALFLLVCLRLGREASVDAPHAIFVLSGLLGCAVVGAFDTVLDVPRVSFLLSLCLLLSLRRGATGAAMRASALS